VIPVDQIVPENLYSQDDALFLLGDGFTKDAAREAICEACRAGEMECSNWRRRYWFTGAAFLEWVARWSGVAVAGDEPDVDSRAPAGHDARVNPEPARRPGGR